MVYKTYYLHNALRGVDFDTSTLNERFWFFGENGWETFSETEYLKFVNYSMGVMLVKLNGVNDDEFEFEGYITYYLEYLIHKDL